MMPNIIQTAGKKKPVAKKKAKTSPQTLAQLKKLDDMYDKKLGEKV